MRTNQNRTAPRSYLRGDEILTMKNNVSPGNIAPQQHLVQHTLGEGTEIAQHAQTAGVKPSVSICRRDSPQIIARCRASRRAHKGIPKDDRVKYNARRPSTSFTMKPKYQAHTGNKRRLGNLSPVTADN